MDTPDIAGYITGWRSWRRTTDGHLRSWAIDWIWPTGKPFAAACTAFYCTHDGKRFLAPNGAVGKYGNMCGVYATKRRRDVAPARVIGRVALWGNVAVHKNGYRASYAYPLSLSDRELAKLYQVAYEPIPLWVRLAIGLKPAIDVSAVSFLLLNILFVLAMVFPRDLGLLYLVLAVHIIFVATYGILLVWLMWQRHWSSCIPLLFTLAAAIMLTRGVAAKLLN